MLPKSAITELHGLSAIFWGSSYKCLNALLTPSLQLSFREIFLLESTAPCSYKAAKSLLFSLQLQGREIYIREDREDFELKQNGEAPPPRPKQVRRQAVSGASLFISNLSFDTSWQTLKDHFNANGQVAHADVFTVSHSNRNFF